MPKDYGTEQVAVVFAQDVKLLIEKHLTEDDTRPKNAGFFRCNGEIVEDLYKNTKFYPRNDMEEDVRYKQIICYIIVRQDEKILHYSRAKTKTSEARLENKRSVGIGGHVNPEDMEDVHPDTNFFSCVFRELYEELHIKSTDIWNTGFLGVVNDDTDEVGKVHIGLVFEVNIDAGTELKLEDAINDPQWLGSSINRETFASMEGWSKLVLEGVDPDFIVED